MNKNRKCLRIQVDYYNAIFDKTRPDIEFYNLKKDKGPYVYYYSFDNEFNIDSLINYIDNTLIKENVNLEIKSIGKYIDCNIKIEYRNKSINYKLINSKINDYFKKLGYEKSEKRNIIEKLDNIKVKKIMLDYDSKLLLFINKYMSKYKLTTQTKRIQHYRNSIYEIGSTGAGGPGAIFEIIFDTTGIVGEFLDFILSMYGILQLVKKLEKKIKKKKKRRKNKRRKLK